MGIKETPSKALRDVKRSLDNVEVALEGECDMKDPEIPATSLRSALLRDAKLGTGCASLTNSNT